MKKVFKAIFVACMFMGFGADIQSIANHTFHSFLFPGYMRLYVFAIVGISYLIELGWPNEKV